MMEALTSGLTNMGNGSIQAPVIFKANIEHTIMAAGDPDATVMSAPLSATDEKDKPTINKAWQNALLQALSAPLSVMHDSPVGTVVTVLAGGQSCLKSTLSCASSALSSSSVSSASSKWSQQKKHRTIEEISIALPAIVPRPAFPQTSEAAVHAQGLSAHHSNAADSVRAGEVAALRVTQPVALVGSEQTLRIHAEWRREGLRLWCGMDLSHPASATELAPQLVRCLNEQGVRLLTLVCNGRAIYADPEVHVPARHLESRDPLQRQQEFPRVQLFQRSLYEHR